MTPREKMHNTLAVFLAKSAKKGNLVMGRKLWIVSNQDVQTNYRKKLKGLLQFSGLRKQ